MNIEKICFSDGEIDSVDFKVSDFIVYFRQWDDQRYKLIFKNIAYLELFEIGTDTNDTVILTESDKLETVKNKILRDGGHLRDYNHFNFKQIVFSSSDVPEYLTVIYEHGLAEIIGS